MKVLYVCAELFPFLKTGGLADVSAGLPPALQAAGCEVRLLMPGYPAIANETTSSHLVAPLPDGPMLWGHAPVLPAASVELATLPGFSMPLYWVRSKALYDRPGNPYLRPDGKEWGDSALRFAALGWAAAALGQGLDGSWVPDVIHCHDWHAGLTPAYVNAFALARQPTPATVFTIHNLAYQGLFPRAVFSQLGLPDVCFDVTGIEFFGQVSFMKAGIRYADRITTVSPTYAREILGESQGCGLDGLLRERANQVSGILNGVDYRVWSPDTDALLPQCYSVDAMDGKHAVKVTLQAAFGLEPRPSALLFGVVSRLVEQKGLHLLPLVIDEMVRRGGQLAVLGQGDNALEQAFVDAAARYPGQVGVRIGYDEVSAHAIVGGADVILLPSEFEPCGLTQLYGLRYGTLPLVHRVGGLADTVVDCTLENLDEDSATGFVFDEFSVNGLLGALRRAFALHRRPDQWREVQARGMTQRFDWAYAALHYLAMYQSLRPRVKPRKRAMSGKD